ncbi:hypothetical protein chiPu_0006551 [Chiloscyllium punctatum]|uniref:Uncharacterized protein n=2 Tax=Chiloscyllium punctatum TaxID=137246 RepID=A0A401SCP4_CHIPU|nr:hypothetical protein [Chiloscyllium punctatum]
MPLAVGRVTSSAMLDTAGTCQAKISGGARPRNPVRAAGVRSILQSTGGVRPQIPVCTQGAAGARSILQSAGGAQPRIPVRAAGVRSILQSAGGARPRIPVRQHQEADGGAGVMEAECRRFHGYQFEADELFQRGLAQLGDAVRCSEERLLEAKVYYYCRFIGPIDLESYKRWLSSQIIDAKNDLAAEEDMTKAFERLLRQTPSDQGQNDETATIETTKVNYPLPIDQQAEKMEDVRMQFQVSEDIEGNDHNTYCELTEDSQIKEPHENKTIGDTTHLSALTTEVTGESCTLSFAQVLHLVQSGQEIPGIQKHKIMSINSAPTVSQMARKLKPWERV